MSLADLKTAHTGKYELHDALLVRAGKPMGTWQNLTIRDESGDYEVSTWYDSQTPDMGVTDHEVNKIWQFRIKAIKNGNFINLRGHIAGPPRKEHEHGKTK